MKNVLMIMNIAVMMFFVGFSVVDAAPQCASNQAPNLQINDPACYTSVTTSSTSTVYDTHNCTWIKTADECGHINGACRWSDHVTSRPIGSCSTSCSTRGYYLHPNPNAGYYRNSCTGATICGNAGIPNPGTYTTSRQVTTNSTTNTCYYTTVDSWSDCDTDTGVQSATAVTQHQINGSNCQNLNESTTRICGVCDPATDGHGTGTAPEPEGSLCRYGDPSPVPPALNAATNMWEWTCSGEDNAVTTEDVSCSAPRDEDGECAMNNPGAQGEYAWNASDFRGNLCDGGTPTISSDFDTVLPMPDTGGNPATVSWGCNHIGVGVSTAATACSASRLAPKPGVCGVDDGGSFSEEADINQQCCNPNSNPPCTNDDTFATNISRNDTVWNWTCNGSRKTGVDAVSCSATCIPEIDVDVSPNPFPLTSDGVTVEVTVTKTGVCAGEYTCIVKDEGPLDINGKVTINNVTSARDIVVICGDGGGDDDDEVYREHISGYCTARECNAQGTCQATPVISSSLNDNRCSSTCSSNADCTTGRIIETRP